MPSRRLLGLLALLAGAACEPVPDVPPRTPPAEVPVAKEASTPVIPDPGTSVPGSQIEGLVSACVAPGTSEVDRARIVQYLASIKSPTGERCYLHALREYKPGVNEETIGVASEAVAALRIEAARAPLFEAFTKLRASRAHGAYRPVYDAMIAIADPAWEAKLVAYLERPVDPKDVAALTDEIFWQQTATVVLGRLRSAAAVRPLLRVILTEDKANLHVDAVLALARIGKPAEVAATAVLKKADAELHASGAGLSRVGLVLATIGHRASAGALLDAINAATDPAERAELTHHLPHLPADARAITAYRGVVDKLPLTVTMTGRPAHEALLERATAFFDASLVPWLADDARRMKGDEGDVAAARETAFIAALKLARADQMKHVDALAALGKPGASVGKAFRKEIGFTRDLLAVCGERVDCWIEQVADAGNQKENAQFRAIKAAYMVGVLGDAAAKAKLVAVLPKITNPAVLFTAVSAIDHLSPDGDAALATTLAAMADEPPKDSVRGRLASVLRTVAVRLQSRLP